jgi:hypothetical protein
MHASFAYPRGGSMEVVFPAYKRRSGWPDKPAWAALAGYDHVKWLPEPGDEAVTLNRLPHIGEHYRVLVYPDFQASSHEAFWVLYTPTLTYLNGWSEHPEELLLSALASCSLVSVDALGDREATITVLVDDVITIPQISQRFPTAGGDTDLADPYKWHDVRRTDYEPYRIIDMNFQSDCGEWLLCQRQASGWVALVYGEWDFSQSLVYVGHRPLTANEVEIIGLELEGRRSGYASCRMPAVGCEVTAPDFRHPASDS